MADDFNPFQPPITAASTATIPPPTTATPPPQLTAPPSSFDNPGPSLAPKRQRRPSVRLGEIGDQPAATLSYDSHVRRAKHPWRFSRDSSAVAATSKSVKARRSEQRRLKRVRSNWVSNSNSKQLDDGADSREELGEEGFRDFDPELDSPMREQKPSSGMAPVFEIHEVDDDVLPMLTLEDLKDMGINAVGSRRKMYSAIQKLGKGFS
ncbi:hypothetical protein F8388_005999 [Cannabis sativa]|uniref:SAM domain-containing protein n=1 Tax=Cannabis sativa TaxID=3483 RepID=A0A7J6H5C2_CANSA|nr:hypothetical protein F8388_005999 [Cannabis sativa]